MDDKIEIQDIQKITKHKKAAKRINRELILKEKIEKAKAEIVRLREKRVIDCGKLAVKNNLHLVEDEILSDRFKRLAVKLGL